ncbi:hypothetical protein IDG88_00430 [Pelagibacterales bacterium SAG-MED03]|nr:hypothetical protein [Pelagibacterales bacterium SAG-MED03]
MTYIIGIHNTGIQSSFFSLSKNKLRGIPEERLSRLKYDKFFPTKNLELFLDENKINKKDKLKFIIAWNPVLNINEKYRASISEWSRHPSERLYSNINQIIPKLEINLNESSKINLDKNNQVEVIYLNHHMAHVYNSYYCSGYSESAIFSCDGYGEKATTFWGIGKGKKIEEIKTTEFPHSLGQLYSTITQYLGFKPNLDEWKVMALASYGDYRKYFKNFQEIIKIKNNGEFELNLNYFDFYNFDKKNYYSKKFESLFGKSRDKKNKLTKKHFDIAAALQKIIEISVDNSLNYLKKKTKQNNLCLSGGVFMNSVMNGKIYRSNLFKNVFIPFAPDDSGNSIGAVCWESRDKKIFSNLSPYQGSNFADKDIVKILNRNKIKYIKVPDVVNDCSDELSKHKIICWFQGRSEFGQRALGNRSILANPTKKDIKDRVNLSVKFRENFRPFAASILEEFANEYYESPKKIISPYMEKVFYIKNHQKSKVPGIVHIDGTTRLQTVNIKQNKIYYSLIKSFYKKTGTPLILNTSFNINKEPIVENPEDALRNFFSSGADILYLGKLKICKNL